MRRLTLALSLLLTTLVATAPRAATLNGRVTGPGGTGVYPVNIDVRDSNTHALLVVAGDTTNATGNYSFTVPGGKYDLTFNPTVAAHLFRATHAGITVAQTATVTTNQVLVAGRYVTGVVLGPGFAPVAGASIGFHDAASGAAAAQVQDPLTEAGGNFRTLVVPGTYNVEIVPTQASRKVPVEFLAIPLVSADSALGTKVLQSGFLVTGTITDASLFPLTTADFDVRLAGRSTKLFTPTDNTNASGAASFVIPPGVYDFTANPPSGVQMATRTAQSVTISADRALPNLALPAGAALTAHCVNSANAPVVNADFDADSLPVLHRLHTPHDASDAAGNVSVIVSLTKFRMNIAPPVATKLLPVIFDSVQVSGLTNLGTVVHPAGHWITVHATEQFTGTPIEGVNLDFVDPVTGRTFLTIDDVTNHDGNTRVVTDQRQFNFLARSPVPGLNDISIAGFRTLNDTTMSLIMAYNNTLGVGDGHGPTLALAEPWPNPARGALSTAITAAVPSDVRLTVLDLVGRHVATLFAGRVLGRHEVTWDARDEHGASAPPGFYLLRLSSGRTTQTRRISLMR